MINEEGQYIPSEEDKEIGRQAAYITELESILENVGGCPGFVRVTNQHDEIIYLKISDIIRFEDSLVVVKSGYSSPAELNFYVKEFADEIALMIYKNNLN